MKKGTKKLLVVAAAAAYGAYRVLEKKGVISKLRFKAENEAISRYLETHYEGATYSPIVQSGNDYTTIVTYNDTSFLLTLTKASEGVYVFSEAEISE